MEHILGMTKSHLDLKGARSSKLELDYLRLIYAVKEIMKRGDSAQGYLVVLTPQILDRVKVWEHKYQGKEYVEVMTISLTSRVKHKLKQEKASNLAGMVAGATGNESGGRSSANFGRETGENALRRIIMKSEPNVQQVRDEKRFPFGIRWDFYGVVN
jgi:hypothetical protein